MKSVKFNPLTSLVTAAALAIGLAGCGSSNEVMEEVMEEKVEMPKDAMGSVTLIGEQQEALEGVLESGESQTFEVAEDGGTEKRAGVTFTCDSAYPYMVTVTNSLGTIVATWKSQTLGDGTADVMAMGLEPKLDAFDYGMVRLNPGNTVAIRSDVVGGGVDANTAEPDFTLTELVGMGIGGAGVTPEQAKPMLRSDFQANGADLTAVNQDGTALEPAAVATPGLKPQLRDGTTISAADHGFDASMSDIADAPDGDDWVMKTLFRDWGEGDDAGDGGFETGAIVVKNLGEGKSYPFDRKLYSKYVNDAAQDMFRLIVNANGVAPTVPAVATSVNIEDAARDIGTPAVNISAATATQWAAMVFDSDSLVGAQTQDLRVDEDETFAGEYFGAPGMFRCRHAETTGGDTGCQLKRNEDGTVGVVDGNSATDGVQGTGRWTFTPDPGAMITVPDQDWIAYGAWLTTPDKTAGDHRLGVFFNGMDTWSPIAGALVVATGLRGMAKYSGGAAGIYVDGGDSGLFTADAMLTAKFDVDNDGADDAGDYTISGRIDDFRGTDGVALGADTGDMPNPQGRGENDWVVVLGMDDLDPTDTTAGAVNGATTGSADGVSWTGLWNGQLFGPSMDADGDALPPSGVAGRFWAETEDPDDTDADMNPVTAVVGAFGATKDADE